MQTRLIRSLLFLFGLFSSFQALAQLQQPPEWTYTLDQNSVTAGKEVSLIFKADIPQDWYLYSSDFDPELGPMVTEFSFTPDASFELVGGITPVKPKKKYDDLWEGEYTYFTGTGEFRQKVRILQAKPRISGTISYQICSDVTGQCIPFETDFSFPAPAVSAASEDSKPEKTATSEEKPKQTAAAPQEKAVQPNTSDKTGKALKEETEADGTLTFTETKDIPAAPAQSKAKVNEDGVEVRAYEPFTSALADTPDGKKPKEKEGLLMFFLIAFGAGLTALVTPCVFPMIPMTVTYFTKTAGDRRKGVVQAGIYGLSIIVIYTLIGTVFALVFGAEFANWLSTHWLPNLFFFAIFILFALSFFGLFEITLPSGFVNKIDRQADKGGYIGIFFMAFTLVLVGFSCTGPIAGTILISAANGEAIMPVVGMLGFSLAFAIPFTLFAIFPGWLSSLPKSGGWLNTVKVVLGFLELALALKFLSVADQVYHWGLLDREVYLALWIVIFTLMGFYLLGKIRLPNDSPLEKISVSRLLMAIATFGFVVYMIPGLVGAPLKSLAGYLPPMSTHDFNLVSMLKGEEEEELPASCEKPKYAEMLHLPHGLKGYFDYEQALACARAQNKPLFIDFTGHGCVNCREMEATVWSDPAVLRRLREDYVVVALYVDEKKELPENEWYVSAYDGKLKKSIGKQNLDFMIQRLNANAQPYYTLVSPSGELLMEPKAYDLNVQNFVDFLDAGLKQHQNLHLAQK